MIDLYTKVVLTVIALALALLVVQPFLSPPPAQAQAVDVSQIENDVHRIARGLCLNSKIC